MTTEIFIAKLQEVEAELEATILMPCSTEEELIEKNRISRHCRTQIELLRSSYEVSNLLTDTINGLPENILP